jgi:hypothetical protein
MPKLNLTIIFIALSAIVIAGIVGGVYLTGHDKDATAFYGFFTATLVTVVSFAGLARSQGSINENLDTVKKNVNGNLSRLIDLATQNATTRSDVEEIQVIGESTGVVPTEKGSVNG